MKNALILASTSSIRAQMLEDAGLTIEKMPARIDESAIKHALLAEGAHPRDIADTLAESKARKISAKFPDRMVLGCDQVLQFKQQLISKPETVEEARDQLLMLRGQTHSLLSAAVIYENAEPVWRHVGVARLTMRSFSDTYLADYLARNWPDIADSVGGYKLEKEGVRLMSHIVGDHFTILGLPLLELLNYLALRGTVKA